MATLPSVVGGLDRVAGVAAFKAAVPLPLTEADFRDKGLFIPNSHPQPSNAISATALTPIGSTKALQLVSSPTNMVNGWINHTDIKLYVSPLTSALRAANEVPAVPIAIPAPCAATLPMAPQNVLSDPIFPIVTKLKADAWELALTNAGILGEFSDIPVGLREGFFCGLENYSLACTFIPPNHYTSQEDEDFITTKYSEEITLGRISHGYDPHTLFSLIGHFRTAPLAVIIRNGKRRVIVNHSFPHNKTCISLDNQFINLTEKITIDPTHTSINTIIDSKKFQCAWGSFSECYLLVADAPEGTQAAVFDVDAAFRNIPTHPSARPFLAIMLKDRIHLDHVLNFGASPSPGIFGRVADAIVKIFLQRGIEAVIKWVDDFVFIRFPSHRLPNGTYRFNYSADLIWNIAAELGWPWALEKFVDFSPSFNYIGFLWNFSTKIVELPERKKTKYLERISTWTHLSTHTLKETEIIIGTLNHVCLVVPEGRSHLVSLYNFRGGFKDNRTSEIKHRLSTNTAEDMLWWRQRLQCSFVGMSIIRPPPPLNNNLCVDASTSWGIGMVLDGRWLAWQFKPDWKSEGREIGWAEMVAIELALRTLITGKFTRCHVIVRSDNQGVVGALKAGRSRGTQQNLILREIVKLIQDNELWVSTIWIPTSENPADDPSRGIFPGKKLLYPHPPKLPFHLTNYIHKAVHYHDHRLQ
jgi:hypothetical protein